jgi:hypothetical protein
MTVTVRELIGSRPIDFQSGRRTSVRMFSVEQDSPALSSSVEVEALFGSNGLPQQGDTLPGSTLQAFEYRIRRFDGQTDLFEVIWQYRDAGGGYVGSQKQPGQEGYVEYSSIAKAEFIPAWRTLTRTEFDELVKQGGLYEYGEDTAFPDIGGSGIDAAGEPLSLMRRTMEITLGVTTEVFPQTGQYFPFIGRRNNTTFLGYPPGSLLYTGADVSRQDIAAWKIGHKFVVDDFYHLVQNARRNPRGDVILNDSSGRADYVYFVQPFPTFGNFYAIDPNFAGLV